MRLIYDNQRHSSFKMTITLLIFLPTAQELFHWSYSQLNANENNSKLKKKKNYLADKKHPNSSL